MVWEEYAVGVWRHPVILIHDRHPPRIINPQKKQSTPGPGRSEWVDSAAGNSTILASLCLHCLGSNGSSLPLLLDHRLCGGSRSPLTPRLRDIHAAISLPLPGQRREVGTCTSCVLGAPSLPRAARPRSQGKQELGSPHLASKRRRYVGYKKVYVCPKNIATIPHSSLPQHS